MKKPKFITDPNFYKLAAAAIVIGAIMYLSNKYEIDWREVIYSLFND